MRKDMIVENLHNSEPLVESVMVDHDELLAELNAFNSEALEILAEAEQLRPQSEAFTKLGLVLDRRHRFPS